MSCGRFADPCCRLSMSVNVGFRSSTQHKACRSADPTAVWRCSWMLRSSENVGYRMIQSPTIMPRRLALSVAKPNTLGTGARCCFDVVPPTDGQHDRANSQIRAGWGHREGWVSRGSTQRELHYLCHFFNALMRACVVVARQLWYNIGHIEPPSASSFASVRHFGSLAFSQARCSC